MQASSPQPPAPEAEPDAVRINLLALNLAIELARADGGLTAPAQAMGEIWALLDDDAQLGAGEGLRRAVEELERVLRQASERPQRTHAEAPATR